MSSNDILIDVIKALADADDLEPTCLEYSLYEFMAPGVIEKLGEMDQGIWELTFRVSDHQVTITHEGRIIVDGVRYSSDLPRNK